ncbi:hypothetical protein BKA67DRAFT_533702 [Truncatella angustata]|uniref:Uncharacterized protein n=1 Tax=Truncatella angustata TaxID=152316 RepID=A0A9P8USZ7_9PEZI|nr:uncharacterized protein BKA67DRAFT_533702 [Truncatella angustata]KAH6658555.1 hypothetical protein BKA67DRAFT_533702 [Truncatella angustata]
MQPSSHRPSDHSRGPSSSPNPIGMNPNPEPSTHHTSGYHHAYPEPDMHQVSGRDQPHPKRVRTCSGRSIFSAPNFTSSLVPQIKNEFDNKAKNGFHVLHVVSPSGTCKSTQFVPRLWATLKSNWPQARGAYVQRILYQARELQRVFEKSVDYRSEQKEFAFHQDSDDMSNTLKLTYYEEFELGLIDALTGNNTTFPSVPLVFFIDLETVPTASGEILVGLFIKYLATLNKHLSRQLSAPDITIVTLASHEATDTYETFEHFLSVAAVLAIADIPAYTAPKIELPGETPEEFLRALVDALEPDFRGWAESRDAGAVARTAVEQTPAPCVLVFLNQEFVARWLQEPLSRIIWPNGSIPNGMRGLVPMALDRCSPPDEVDKVLQAEHYPKVICVDHSFPVVLSARVTHIASPGAKVALAFHQDSTHCIDSLILLSKSELQWEDAWADVSGTPGIKYFVPDSSHVAVPDLPKRPVEGELMYFAYRLVQHWSSCPLTLVPVPYLTQVCPLWLNEMFRRMKALGCVKRALNRQWTRTPLGRVVQMFMDNKFHDGWLFNPGRSFQLACLCAIIFLDRQDLTVKAKRILIRMASIIRANISTTLQINEDRLEELGLLKSPDCYRTVRGLIHDCTGGVARQQIGNGLIWVVLGLWQTEWVHHGTWKGQNEHISCQTKHLPSVGGTVRKSEKLEPLDHDEEVFHTQLDESELEAVNTVLLRAYMHQQVLFPDEFMLNPVDLISNQPVCLTGNPAGLFDSSALQEQGVKLGLGAFTAIYTSAGMESSPDEGSEWRETLRPEDLTFIPRKAQAALATRLRVPMHMALRTSCPVPTYQKA